MISVHQLIETAQAQTGLSDLGETDIVLANLNRLVDSVNAEAQLTERGEQSLTGALIGTLVNRMKVEDYLKQHPELLERPIEKPMFVFGLPRTGTTLTINLLNADPARRSALRWEMFDSVPPPFPEELHAGPRFQKAQDQIDMSMKYTPQISAIHHEDGDSPSECQFLMSPTFCAQVYDSQYEVPSYHKWFLYEADYLPAFRYHKRILQLLQANAPGRWTLKNPWHPLFLNALTSVYPDAQLVMTHRDPVEVLGSACSLLKTVRVLLSDAVDPISIGANLLETFELMIERQNAYRAQHGAASIYDVHYLEQMRDPIGSMKKLYAHFDEPFTPEAEAAMNAFMNQNPKGKHGKHEYTLEEYGMSAGQIRERFKAYCQQFGVGEYAKLGSFIDHNRRE